MEKLELFGEIPEPRFGHTVTQISSTKVILFGGATGTNGKYSITSDTYILDLITKKWRKIEPQGTSPSERAAHASLSVQSLQLILYGGATGGGDLATEDLLLLDLRMGEDKSNWIIIPTVGLSPGRRYGHSMVFSTPYLIIFGGVPGNDPSNNVFTLNVDKSPFTWVQLIIKSEMPCPRVYHSASLCSNGSAKGMMVIFGGRALDQSPLNDTWGLRKNKDGRWDWVKIPYKPDGELPTPRFQHSILFINSLLFVIGGRTNSINELLSTNILDMELNCWYKMPGISRFRQANWIFENFLYIHGGLDQSNPNLPITDVLKIDLVRMFQDSEPLIKAFSRIALDYKSRETNMIKYGPGCNYYHTAINPSSKSPLLNKAPFSNIVMLSTKAYVGSSYHPFNTELNRKIIKVSIIKLHEESKKIGANNSVGSIKTINMIDNDEVTDYFIDQYLISGVFDYNTIFQMDKIYLEKLCTEVEKLFQKESTLIRIKSPIKIFGNLHGQLGDLLNLFMKFGIPSDSLLHGDIEGFSYLFLGDYIDKGKYSLETLILLFCFKIKHPESFFMLRGHHEDIFINKIFGFGEECSRKLEEDINDPSSFFWRINKLLEYLPLAALVDNEILCVHGGIGHTLKTIEEIERLERPIEISHNPQNYYDRVVLDLLLSDPTTDENETENQPNSNRDYLKSNYSSKFTLNRVMRFLKDNKLKRIIRSHECVVDGYEALGLNSLVITIFSTMDYYQKNGACILMIKKNMEIAPKIIFSSEDNRNVKWKVIELEKNSFQLNENEEKMRTKGNTPPRNSKFKNNI